MADKPAKEFIARHLPDLEIVETARPSASDAASIGATAGASVDQLKAKYMSSSSKGAPGADDKSPQSRLDALRQKFQGSAPADAARDDVESGAASLGDAASASDVEVVQVRPKKSPADPVDDPGPRTVIVSKTKGILGTQG